jgi:hypothetical protein
VDSRARIQKKEKAKAESATPKSSDSAAAAFLKDGRWAKVLMLTITHALYILWEPFLDFLSESPVFLKTMQKVFNLSFPNVDFKLASNDPIIKVVWTLSHPLIIGC